MEDKTAKIEEKLCEMISTAGAARSTYIGAIQAAKTGEGNPAALMEEGNGYFQQAHEIHHELLTMSSEEGSEGLPVTMFLVHVEDQLMCAETFRILAEEFIDLYRKMEVKG